MLSPYLRLIRLHSPAGTWLLLWPCWWSISIASASSVPDIYLLLIFAAGAFMMRSAGCVINDMWDREIDAKVERTRLRPLASGELSMGQAGTLLFFLLLFGLMLLLQLNIIAIQLGIIILLPIIAYPLMKRFFPWPQLILALVFNWGALIGWAAVNESLSNSAYALYAACIFWTLAYDTIYAHQDKTDDRTLGVHSTALSFGQYSKTIIALCYILMLVLLILVGLLEGLSMLYFAGAALAFAYILYRLRILDLSDAHACMAMFNTNSRWGAFVFAIIVIEKWATIS